MEQYQKSLDGAAFDLLVNRFMLPAYSAARRILGDEDLAEDAVQEAFLRVVRDRNSYRPSFPFSVWFYTILRNVCRDIQRRRLRQAALIRRVAHFAARRTASGRRTEAEYLLERLPETLRVVLLLRIRDNLSFRQIAAVLGISEEAAKKRGQRGLRLLRLQAQQLERNAPLAPGP